MNKNHKNTVCKIGEDYTEKFLISKGCKIIGRNIRVGRGEIDIIARFENLIIFVEVKARKSEAFIALEDSMSGKKKQKLFESCEKYIALNSLDKYDFRIDLAGVIVRNNFVKDFRYVRGII